MDIPDLSRHFSLSFIVSGKSSGLHPVSSQSCCMYVRAGHPAFTRPYAGVHGSTSLMSSSLLLQQCPACLVRLTWKVFVVGGRWPYSWGFVGCCRQGSKIHIISDTIIYVTLVLCFVNECKRYVILLMFLLLFFSVANQLILASRQICNPRAVVCFCPLYWKKHL